MTDTYQPPPLPCGTLLLDVHGLGSCVLPTGHDGSHDAGGLPIGVSRNSTTFEVKV